MKALVVYDSVFGNTEKVAQAVAGGLGSADEVSVVQVKEVNPQQMKDLDILVVGSPTRAFKSTPLIKDFIKQIPPETISGVTVAAFDTRIAVEDTNSKFLKLMVKLFGYAAQPMAAKLTKRGGTTKAPPEGFFVEGTEGPLKNGELERATAWAKKLRS